MDRSFQLKKGDCIRYGELPEGAKVGSRSGVEFPKKAPALKSNVVYGLGIREKTPNSGPTHGYVAVFCLKQDDTGALVVKK
jgi:hypothetical protein